jgi:ABC-2 type transport system permease protein
MNAKTIQILVAKDLMLFFRNRLFLIIPLLSMVLFLAVYFLLPAEPEAGLTIGITAPQPPEALMMELQRRNIDVQMVATQEQLFEMIRSDAVGAGLVLSAADLETLAAGREIDLSLYLPASAPREFGQSLALFVKTAANDAAFNLSGQALNLTFDEQVVGADLVSGDIATRDRLLPMFAVVLLMVEAMGLATLITEEVERRTLRALLMTPMRLVELFAAKGISGVGLAFVQVTLLMAITGGLWRQPLLVLVALLLGALLVTGVGFLIAVISKNMMSVIAWGTLSLIVLGLPAFNLIFPGTVARWVNLLPTYYLVDVLHRVINFQAGWAAVAPSLLALLAMGLAALGLGTALLRRKLQWT